MSFYYLPILLHTLWQKLNIVKKGRDGVSTSWLEGWSHSFTSLCKSILGSRKHLCVLMAKQPQVVISVYTLPLLSSYWYVLIYILLVVSLYHAMVQSEARRWLTLACVAVSAVLTQCCCCRRTRRPLAFWEHGWCSPNSCMTSDHVNTWHLPSEMLVVTICQGLNVLQSVALETRSANVSTLEEIRWKLRKL